MNLFINENFIDTVGTKPSVIQLIRQIAEDDEIVYGEVLEALRENLDYANTAALEDDIRDGDVEGVAILDDALYVEGDVLIELFENLYPGDHTAVIAALVASIQNSDGPTLRVDHNGIVAVAPEVETAPGGTQLDAFAASAPTLATAVAQDLRLGEGRTQNIAEPVPANHVITAINNDTVTVRAVETAPFPGYSEGTEVRSPEVAVLNSEAVLGELKVNGCVVPVRQVIGKNGVLFSVDYLYHAVYNLQHNPDYLSQILVEYRSSLDSEDVLFVNGGLYLTVYGLAKLHGRLCHIIEWQPLVAKIVNQFTLNPYDNVSFDLLGNQVG